MREATHSHSGEASVREYIAWKNCLEQFEAAAVSQLIFWSMDCKVIGDCCHNHLIGFFFYKND